MRAIYLTGFMGSGKTTVGAELGKVLQLPVIDTDQWIEQQKGKQIRDIFAQEGEAVFRRYEYEALQKLPKTDTVITTGGGIIIQEQNRAFMKKNGTVFYLHCDLDEIYTRLENDTTRPLLDGAKRTNIENLMSERRSWYEEAEVIIDTTGRSIEEIVKEIVNVIKERQRGDNK
ncbi:shikimate kinase [Bacillus tianshenii]|nr:shikimate kinase [Bacillus tianshenii]